MNKKLLNKLDDFFRLGEHHKIIETINKLSTEDMNYELINHLGRAYNNINEFEKAVETLIQVSEQGETDSLWNFRIGYAYYFKNQFEKALPFFEKSYELGDETAKEFISSAQKKVFKPENKISETTKTKIKDKISKNATIFKVGGFRPENTIQESWIGKVSAYKVDETIPTDKNGELMLPLAQIYIPNLPFIHPRLSNTKLLTVFISRESLKTQIIKFFCI